MLFSPMSRKVDFMQKIQKESDLKKTNQEINFEKQIESALEKLMTHPLFLETVSFMLNLNSYKRIFLRQNLSRLWKSLELPNKHDQEKTLFLISDLQHKIMRLERELDKQQKVGPVEKSDDVMSTKFSPIIKIESASSKKKKYSGAPLKS